MAVPKKQTTSRKSKLRRSHHALKNIMISKCPKCGEPILSHIACKNCGFYADKKVLDVETKLDKKIKKQEKEA